jgi:hypothetical protein
MRFSTHSSSQIQNKCNLTSLAKQTKKQQSHKILLSLSLANFFLGEKKNTIISRELAQKQI